jgi:hypothetical protein
LKTVNTIPKSIPALGQIQVKSNTGPGLVSSNLGHMAGTRLPPNLNGNNQVHLYNSQPLHPTQIAKNQVLNKKTVEITRNPE